MSNFPKAVILLGAGASKGSSHALPVMREMFADPDDADTLHPSLRGEKFPILQEALSLFTDSPSRANLEEFLTHLDLWISIYRQRWGAPVFNRLPEIAAQARIELEDYLEHRLEIPADDQGDPDHVKLFLRLGKADTILTLNYDRVAEDSLQFAPDQFLKDRLDLSYSLLGYPNLRDGGVPASLTARERARGLILKLHGSLSWKSCPRSECVQHFRIVETSREEVGRGMPCRSGGAVMRRVLVAPSLAKGNPDWPRMELLWHHAFRELSHARELVVVGVALPPSDSRLRWLLRASQEAHPDSGVKTKNRNKKLIVVDPSEEAARNITAACRLKAETHPDLKAFLSTGWVAPEKRERRSDTP